MNFEDDLRAALRHEPPPGDFATKVLRRTQSSTTRPRLYALPLAAAVAAAAIIPAAFEYRQHQRTIEAREQLAMALSITQTQLEHTKQKIRENVRHRQ